MSGFLKKIVVPIDSSPASSHGVALALRLGRAFGDERPHLAFCSAVDYTSAGLDSAPVVIEAMIEVAGELLSDAVRWASRLDIPATSEVLQGIPARVILEYAENKHADAIVMGTGQKVGWQHLLLGSTTEAVLRAGSIPVFTVSGGDTPETEGSAKHRFARILVGIDESDPSDAAIDFAAEFGRDAGAELVLVHVIDENKPYQHVARWGLTPREIAAVWEAEGHELLTIAEQRASDLGARVTHRIIETGDVGEALLVEAARCGADLIVTGSHGRRGLQRMAVGSVAEEVVRKSSIPVAVVRCTAAKRTSVRIPEPAGSLG